MPLGVSTSVMSHHSASSRRLPPRRPWRQALLAALLAAALAPALAGRNGHPDPALRSMERGEFLAAIRIYSQRLRHDPTNARLANNLALAHAMLHNRSTALAWLEQARRLAPGDPVVRDNALALRRWLRQGDARSTRLRIDTRSGPGQPLRIRRSPARTIVF